MPVRFTKEIVLDPEKLVEQLHIALDEVANLATPVQSNTTKVQQLTQIITGTSDPKVLFLTFSHPVASSGVQTIPIPGGWKDANYNPICQLINSDGNPTGMKIFFESRKAASFDIDAGEAGTLFVTLTPKNA